MAVRHHEVLHTHNPILCVHLRRPAKRLLAGGLLAFASACGGSSPLPTSPSGPPGVITTVTPTPVTLRRGMDAVVFQLTGDVSFHNGGSGALRLIALDVELTDIDGARERQRLPLDLALDAGRTAARPLVDNVAARIVRAPVRLTITARAISDDGQPVDLEPVTVPVIVAAPVTAAALAAPVTFVGAGDIANCALTGAESTARLLDAIPGEIFTLGDHVYPDGTAEAFAGCYEATWGRHRARTHPAPGNHDWDVNAGAAYLAYFRGAAGAGFYSFNLGAWHVLSLNSNVGAQPGSPQYEWARSDLAASAAPCTMAYWHHPLFSSGANGNNPQMRNIWRLLDEAGVEMVLVGHDHLYERFAPQDADGRATPTGIRQFTVGTGGAQPYGAANLQPNSETRIENAWGVLKLTLRSDGFDWEFVPAGVQSTRDFGSGLCGS